LGDPEALNHIDWHATGVVMIWVWLIVVFVLGFATHMVLAKAIIPSLIDSGHIPDGLVERVRKMRLPLYMTAFMIVGAIAFVFFQATDAAHEIRRFFPRDWI
jgi:hypothetical protein